VRRDPECSIFALDPTRATRPRHNRLKEVENVLLGDNYPFLEVMWTVIVIFAWVIWFWLLITVFADLFRRDDAGGWTKALWIVFVILIPYFGVLIYLIVNHQGMADRAERQSRAQQKQFDQAVREAAGSGGTAAEIEKAKQLLDSGAISQAEFDQIKAKALAST
jgi:Short C-terminal domain/Phospholipase_D-nuclease N-terminal